MRDSDLSLFSHDLNIYFRDGVGCGHRTSPKTLATMRMMIGNSLSSIWLSFLLPLFSHSLGRRSGLTIKLYQDPRKDRRGTVEGDHHQPRSAGAPPEGGVCRCVSVCAHACVVCESVHAWVDVPKCYFPLPVCVCVGGCGCVRARTRVYVCMYVCVCTSIFSRVRACARGLSLNVCISIHSLPRSDSGSLAVLLLRRSPKFDSLPLSL